MTLDLTVDELLTSTRSVRKRLDFDKPVPREVLMECLDLALQAPTGSNAQGWQFLFVEDPPAKKKALADIYRATGTPYLDMPAPVRGDMRDAQMDSVLSSAKYLNENLEKAPVFLIPCLEGRPDGAPPPECRRPTGVPSFPPSGVSCWPCVRAGWARPTPRCI